jgi:DNA-binding CsgD family transcriptional regulator
MGPTEPILRVVQARSLVGREDELARLRAAFEACAAGHAHVLVVAGDPGIGKTHLLEAAAADFVRLGGTCLRGTGIEAEGMPAYLPFLQALRQHLASASRDEIQTQVGPNAPALATVLPELADKLGSIPVGLPLPDEQARLRLFESVADFLAAMGSAKPVALLLDDLDSADPTSLELLCHIVRHRPEGRLLILGASREGAARENTAFERAVYELERLRRLTRLRLDPLPAESLAQFAEQFLGGPVSPEVSRKLHAQSEGNPFFAEELLRDWLEAGVLTRVESSAQAPARWRLTGTLPTSLPPSIASAVRQRLARLPSEVVDALRVASVAGRSFALPLLAEATAQDDVTLGDRLLTAERAHLIESREDGTFGFRHDKIRECLYAEVSSARRRRLHEKIGLILESDPSWEARGRISELAFHFARSGDSGRGARYSRLAAEQALKTYAPEQALLHFRRTRDLLSPDDPSFGEVLMGLADAALQAASPARAEEAYSAAQAWFQTRGDHAASARAARGRGNALWRLDEMEEAEAAFHQALLWVDREPANAREAVLTRVDAADFLGTVLGRLSDGIRLIRQALLIPGLGQDPRLESAASRTLGFLLVLDNDLLRGRELLERALALALEAGDVAHAADVCASLAQAFVWSGEFHRSREISLRREQWARASYQIEGLAYVYSWLAFLGAVRGDWPEAERWIRPAEAAVDRLPSQRPAAFLRQVRGYLAFQKGDYAAAEADFQAALSIFRDKDPMEFVLCVGLLGLCQLHLAKGHLARQAAREQEEALARTSAGNLASASARSTLALCLILLGETDRANSLYSWLLPYRGQHHWFLADRVLGEIACQRGDWDVSTEHLAEAEAIASREALKPELGRTYMAQAQLALGRGGQRSAARARERLQRALEVFQTLGSPAEGDRVKELLASLPSQPVSSSRGHLPGRLSDREAQVLRHLAAGKTNRQIARVLALSDSTVAKHLTSIYGKLGVDNRAAAAALAIRLGLG